MAPMTQLAKLFPRKKRFAEEGLNSLLTMNNGISKRHFKEELRFERVVQAASLSVVLLLKSNDRRDALMSSESTTGLYESLFDLSAILNLYFIKNSCWLLVMRCSFCG